jgi:hypothetical protein
LNDFDMDLFSVAYVSGFIARHGLCGVRCDDFKTCLTSPLMLSTKAFIYFKEYKDYEQSLINEYPEGMVGTVISSVTVLNGTCMMAGVAYTNLFEENIRAAFKNTVDFRWI